MSIELDDFKHKAGGEIADLTNCIQAIARDRKIDIKREFIYNILEDAVEKIHEEKLIKKVNRRIRKRLRRRIREILGW